MIDDVRIATIVADVAGSMAMSGLPIPNDELPLLRDLAIGAIDFAQYCDLVGVRQPKTA